MMSNNDVECLLDENFVAMDESHPFDRLEDENNRYFAESNKYKKKDFTSLWRKPKIGRRKTKSVGKKLPGDSYDMSINEFDTMPSKEDSKRGKIVKGRESFDSFASVPLSDFDNVKDNLAFLNLRSNNMNTTKSPKKTALNPKMFLTHPPVNRRDIKNKFKKDRVTKKYLEEEEESRDIFKPIHNTNNDHVFDAFQILPKESPNKTKPKDEAEKKPKEEESDDQYDKENYSKETFYGAGLYHDHGPILSSLSEDTIQTDSVRGEPLMGEKFLDDEFEPKKQWKALLGSDFEEEDTWESLKANNKNFFKGAEKVEPVIRPAKVEKPVGSFNDRLKLFQTKDTEPTQKRVSDLTKPKSFAPVTKTLERKVVEYGGKSPEDEVKESAVVPEKSVLEKTVSEKAVEPVITKTEESVTTKVNEVGTFGVKPNTSSYYNSYGRNMKSFGALSNRFKEMQTNTGNKAPTSSYQANSYKPTSEKTSFKDIPKKKIVVQSSEKVQSSVVDLSMLQTLRKQVPSKSIEKDISLSQRNSTEPSMCSEEEKLDSNKIVNNSAKPNRISELSTYSALSYSSNYRSSLNSHKSAATNFGQQNLKSTKSTVKSEIEKESKTASSQYVKQESEAVSSDESKSHSVSIESERKNDEMKKEKATDSFAAARLRFGGRLQQSRNMFENKIVSNIQSTEKKDISDENKETTNGNIQLDSDMVKSIEAERDETKKKSGIFAAKKSFESMGSVTNAEDRFSISSTGTQKTAEKKLGISAAKKSFESMGSVTNAEDRFSISSTGTQKTTTKPSFVKKSSFDPTPKKTNVASSKPSLETTKPAINDADTKSLDSEHKSDLNESTANTTISTLTCDSALPSNSYAQQSASIFGVTLSKRKKRFENVPAPKESQAPKKSIETYALSKESDGNAVSDKFQSTKTASNIVEKELTVPGKQDSLNEVDEQRKLSTSSVSIHSVDMKSNRKVSLPSKEESAPVVASFLPVKNNHQETKSCHSDLKVKTNAFSRKVKPNSIAARLKMFEKPSVTSQDNSNNDVDNTEDADGSDSPKSVLSSESSSSFEVSSVATRRRETGSGIISESDIVPSEVEKIDTSPNQKDSDVNANDDLAERRRTLKSVRATTSSFKPQATLNAFKRPEVRNTSNVFKKTEEVRKANDNKFNNDNSLRNRLSTLRALKMEDQQRSEVDAQKKSLKSEENVENKVQVKQRTLKSEEKVENKKVEVKENSTKEPSPPTRDAYSMRRKFFENLDRKRVQASMSRPLVTQTEPISTHNNKPHHQHEIEIIGDDILRENNDLPMLVEFEEDFMLKDNISTCLSASEQRSVVCKPDALLYSVSQKALGLMSAKAESNSFRSFSRNNQEQDRGTIDHGLKFNRFKSSGNGGSSSHSEFRNRFARKINERETAGDAEEDNTNVETQQSNKFRTSGFSQGSNRFSRNKVASEVRPSSEETTEAVNDMQGVSVESQPSTEPKRTGPMTISERRKFFESQKKARTGLKQEEQTASNDYRKRSDSVFSQTSSHKNGIKNRPSDGSEMTSLAGAGFAEQSVTNLKRVSSTSMGTLDYSFQSSQYSKHSEVSKNQTSSAPQNTYGRFNRGNASAAGNRSSKASASKNNTDLRCF